MFYYRIYGLTIQSEIELPEAYEIEEQNSDVVISYGKMPVFIKKKKDDGFVTSILFRKYKWFYFKKEGDFLIENGTTITVELDTTADQEHIRALILGSCLGGILYQREIVSIHGSAVVWEDKVIIISGASGAGKSTVSSELRKRGCLFLADDTVAITIEDDTIFANPSYPQQKLCPDAAIRFGYNLDELILLKEECEKYAIRLKDSFCAIKKEVKAFIYLDIKEDDQAVMREISGSLKLEYIVSNLYTYMDCENGGLNLATFEKCLEIARRVPVIKIERPLGLDSGADIAEMIINYVIKMDKILI